MQKIVFLWENFGPYHVDRMNAVADSYYDKVKVIGIELSGKSISYDWERQSPSKFDWITISENAPHFFSRSKIWQIIQLLKVLAKIGRADFFLCHYEQISVFSIAVFMRLFRQRAFIMNDMKYSDFKRNLFKEFVKSIFHAPYVGAIAAGRRSADYFRFLGVPEHKIHLGYGAVSLNRLDNASNSFSHIRFEDRPFIVVARLLPMKNLYRILDAYNLYRNRSDAARELHICGSGPLEQQLRDYAAHLNLTNHIRFRGHLKSADVTNAIRSSLCLILFSTQETFGNVIIEAVALGVPVIATPICGATDEFVKSGVNGFLVEPDNIHGLANLMLHIESDEQNWSEMSHACSAMRSSIDIANFAQAVHACIAPGLRA